MAKPMDLSDEALAELGKDLMWPPGRGGDIARTFLAIRDAATAAERERCALKLEAWAQDRWKAEVQHRPVENIHRRTLDETWKQVERDGPTALRGGDHE